MYTKAEMKTILASDRYPRSAKYDPGWVLENQMGPNVLWLTESLAQLLELKPAMRVLDLGCGKAISSIFLAKEFDLQVWAADLWINPSENWKRIKEVELEDQVYPIYAEAHTLPFGEQFFDAILSMDAYHYFGTDELYLGYILRFLKSGGQIGVIVPGLREEIGEHIPTHLKEFWQWEFYSFHSPTWWRRHWSKTGLVSVELADLDPDGWQVWLRWEKLIAKLESDDSARKEAEMLSLDAGRNLGFTRIVARKK